MNKKDKKLLQFALTKYQEGSASKAVSLLESLVEKYPNSATSVHYLGVCYYELNKQDQGIKLIKKSLLLSENNDVFLHNLGSFYRLEGKFDLALTYVLKSLKIAPKNIIYLGTLTTIYLALKQFDNAKKTGGACLKYKDKQACHIYEKEYKASFSLNKINANNGYQPNDINVISFCLWGDNPIYTHGAVINARIAPYIYPEWKTKFYLDESVPLTIRETLQKYGAEIIYVKHTKSLYHNLLWRFLISDDTSVTRFICRDCDSRLNVREKNAVDAWVSSGKLFHIMRDSYMHAELILAGMWGGVSGALPPIQEMVSHFNNPFHEKWIDQTFLANLIWPMIKNDALTHDTYYAYHGGTIFPEDLYRRELTCKTEVGQIVRDDLNNL